MTEYDYTTENRKGRVLWFTGLSGAGKTAVADKVYEQLSQRKIRCERLDGDFLRKDLNVYLGFSEEGRKRNIDIAGFIAKLLSNHGIWVIASFISPYRAQRDAMKRKISNFIEIYVNASLDVCEQRDVKGLYKKARKGEICDFTGISHPYEHPLEPDIILNTDIETVEESAAKVVNFLKKLYESG